MVGEDKKMVIQLQSLLKHVDEENQESFLNDLYDAYSDPNSTFQLSDLIKQFDDELDRKPAARQSQSNKLTILFCQLLVSTRTQSSLVSES